MFVSDPVFRALLERPRHFQLIEDFIWRGDIEIVVPAGFVTDLASIPRPIQLLPSFGQTGRSLPCGILHDWGYARQTRSRTETDELFRLTLLAVGVNQAAARMFWLGVRTGGWRPWAKYRKALAKELKQ